MAEIRNYYISYFLLIPERFESFVSSLDEVCFSSFSYTVFIKF